MLAQQRRTGLPDAAEQLDVPAGIRRVQAATEHHDGAPTAIEGAGAAAASTPIVLSPVEGCCKA
jgi:hypothetical protein